MINLDYYLILSATFCCKSSTNESAKAVYSRRLAMEDSSLKRIGISMEGHLLSKFDGLVEQKGYENRSEAVRDLVRDALLQHSWEKDEQLVAGSILLFYDHHKRMLPATSCSSNLLPGAFFCFMTITNGI